MADFRFFDHTGDFGLELTADGAEEAVAGVARAFLQLLTEAPQTVREVEAREIAVSGFDEADTLVAFANELLFLFEVEGFLCARFAPVAVGPEAIEGTAHGEPYDPDRHPIARPIKAVTHHGVQFEPAPPESGAGGAGWTVRLIFDL